MNFASPIFLWYFLPIVLVGVLATPRSWRNGVIAIASLVFYAAGAGPATILLLGCMAVNFSVGPFLERDPWEEPDATFRRKALLVGAITADLAVLVVWKYLGFATQQIAYLARLLGTDFPVVHLLLPIGISFFTFHHISYLVDVYRGDRPALRNPVSFVAYIAMFPQLVAGPIVRYREIADQLPQRRTHRLDDIASGFPRFALGLTKKVMIADSIAPVVDACFATHDADMTTAVAWLGAIGYTLQLYYDFSGYSDMAIGMARMLGFRLPENFTRPYSSVTITEFWRRWHQSLSRWFKDYVYIPLGGNRRGAVRTYRNLCVVFVLTGFWHGANWTFLIWGLYHGALLVIERATRTGAAPHAPAAQGARRALTLLLVVIGWVFFRAADLGQAGTMLWHMAVPDLRGAPDVVDAALTHQRAAILLLALIVVFLPANPTGPYLEAVRTRTATIARIAVMTGGLAYAAVLVASGTFAPFLYYQF